jgi:hypothetical protein
MTLTTLKRQALRILFFIAVIPVIAIRAQADLELPLQASYELSTEPLSTEKVWVLDPQETNPHRVRWVLTKHVELSGLRAVREKSGEGFRVEAQGLFSKSVAYTRHLDPTYTAMEHFPCSSAASVAGDWFATEEGARFAADRAAQLWEDLLSRKRIQLDIRLKHIHGEFSESSLKNAQEALASWLDELETNWTEKVVPQVRNDEWKFYQKLAHENGLCGQNSQSSESSKSSNYEPPTWSLLMEKPPTQRPPHRLLARAPARRWGGLYSILVSMKIQGKVLVGKFLIDSGAPVSLISPSFLQNQGAQVSWVADPKLKPSKVYWSGGSGVGNPAYVGDVSVSGLPIENHRFYLHESDFFGPPESFSVCCDGILGSDFLRQYAVEFINGKGPEVNLYARDGFSEDTPWVETHFNPGHEIISDCTATPRQGSAPVLRGVIWDTGNEEALEFNLPPSPQARAVSRWDLNCGPAHIANRIQASVKEAQAMTDTMPLDVGVDLMARGPFTFDLGHGRIWFSPQGLALPIVQNHSGLNLEYIYYDGDRFLKVRGIKKKSASESLRKAGLKEGMTILTLDGKSTDDMDTWEVEQRLSGVYGDTVAVEWETGRTKVGLHVVKKSKIAPISLPPIAP